MFVTVGFYGKLPSHGDFLRRRMPDGFVEVWDSWLQDCLAGSRAALGERWLETYLTSPAWRFASMPSAICPTGTIGVMVPSVDRVGRYFYVTIAATLPPGVQPGLAAVRAGDFFEQAEALAVEAVSTVTQDVEAFDERVRDLAACLEPLTRPDALRLDASAAQLLAGTGMVRWHVPMTSAAELAELGQQMLWTRLAAVTPNYVLWWTDGSTAVDPSTLITPGLPDADGFAAMLDGVWCLRRWQSLPATVVTKVVDSTTLVDDLVPPRYRSAAKTDIGCVRTVNQDAYLERSEAGLWVVADGMGGHRDGEVASRMVCDALADFLPDGRFDETIDQADRRLQEVNDFLTRTAERSGHGGRSGSTVAVLLTRGSRCAVLWAGDSRIYRWRDGRLERLTHDHTIDPDGISTAITRAVGGEAVLTLDVLRDRVRPGDRFLLCSDGLTRSLPESQIAGWIAHPDCGVAVDGLIAATLAAGAPDNVTAVVVEAYV